MSQKASMVCAVNIDYVFEVGALGLFVVFVISIIDPTSRETIIKRISMQDPFEIYKNPHNVRYWIAIAFSIALPAVFLFLQDGCNKH